MDKKTIQKIKFALMDKRKREFEEARRQRKLALSQNDKDRNEK
jgi:hypothetical protein